MKGPICWAIVLAISVSSGLSETGQSPNLGPVQAELVGHLDVRRLKPGDTVFARLTQEWSGQACALRKGAILEATVETAELHSARSASRLALSFTRAQCNGTELEPMKLLVAAVAGPPEDWRVAPNPEFRVAMSSLLSTGQMSTGFGGMGISNFAGPTLELTGVLHRFPMSPKVKPGDVLGIRGMKLEMGTGPNQSSVLTAKSRNLSLDAYTQMLLVPAALVIGPGAHSLLASGSPGSPAEGDAPMRAVPRPPPAPPVNDLETCAPPGCAVDLPVSARELANQNGAAISLQPLGYAPRSRKMRGEFEHEEELAWLGAQQILVAFNPHPLIPRTQGSGAGSPHRMIRAILLDVQSHSVVRAVDWEITDKGRYLWSLNNERILVHVGNELRIYRAGLELERSIPLGGPLAFVRISPNGELLALATVRERHSPELHTKLRDDVGEEPEEDVDVAVLDKAFNTIAQAASTSSLQAPTLLNEGQVRLLSQPNMHFRLTLNTWDHKSVTLARFASRCIPELASVAPDLLFLLSCDVSTGATTYRVLKPDGTLLLRGEAGPRDVGHEASGNEEHAMFAIKVVHAVHELSPGIEFTNNDLESQEVRVYRASDGKRLVTVRANDPVASHDSYALSPDGGQLAVLTESQIRFFPVPLD